MSYQTTHLLVHPSHKAMARRGFEVEPMQWLEQLAFTAAHQSMQRQVQAGMPLTVADTHHIVARMLAGKPERVEPAAITPSRMARVLFAKRHRKEHALDAGLVELYGIVISKVLPVALGPEGQHLIAIRICHVARTIIDLSGELAASTPHLAKRVLQVLRHVVEAADPAVAVEVLNLLPERYREALALEPEVPAALPSPATFGFIDYFVRGTRSRLPVQFFPSVLGQVSVMACFSTEKHAMTLVDEEMNPVTLGGLDAVLSHYRAEYDVVIAERNFESQFQSAGSTMLDRFRQVHMMKTRSVTPAQARLMVEQLQAAFVASEAVAHRDMGRFFDEYPDLSRGSHRLVPTPDPAVRVFTFAPA